ncbi:MAG TPA: DEAD/DEAH box helicase [Acidimicrobiales bacterium]|nr:DEAD/DEAH box helicase [Acidimicrobiales bacterium]
MAAYPVRAGPDLAFRETFAASLGFDLDPFQVDALDALDRGCSVVVAAPTGSGKTVVAEYAVARALQQGRKAFYTTPLKALSNQKYGDLVRRHGADQVGLLTGDNAINGDAPVVVMTTEVLRNMIYAGAGSLDSLRYVILDEVHYLQNAYRGPVWEEVIIHTPAAVDLVCLSATVSNAEELADWIRTVRGETSAVIEDRRPVELHNLYLLGDRSSERPLLFPTFVDGRPNHEVSALDSKTLRHAGLRGRPRGRLYTPRRADVVELLGEQRMLPAIYFIFSRAGCDEAVAQCLREGQRLTTPEERRQIVAIAESHLVGLSDEDLRVLDHAAWIGGLEAGLAAHHAGMVPPFKEAVEACFAAGLVKVVFATETLSLGINMPARSVVIEKLTKFTGERHEFLTPGEYTQLTGRAGRRGIDEVGYAVVLWSPFVPFDQVAGLAGTRTYALTSSFRPTYNMAANLVRRYPPDIAHHLLNLSFAQYRADSDVVRLEAQLDRVHELLADAQRAVPCDRGDVEEYRRLVQVKEEPAGTWPSASAEVAAALERVRPGDVLVVRGGKSGGRVAVLATSRRRHGDLRVRAITSDRRILSLGPKDFAAPPRSLARVALPVPYAPNNAAFQRRVASALSAARISDESLARVPGARHRRGDLANAKAEAVAAHPVAGCPDARHHLRAAERAERLARDADRLERRIRGRTESLARQFDRVLRVLEAWGCVDGWSLTPAGQRLARVYHESDLLVAECLEQGLLDGLETPELAALVSAFTYEARGPSEATPRFPGRRLRERWTAIDRLAAELNDAEDAAGLPLTRRPDPGFIGLAHGWAAGQDLEHLLGDQEVSGGDFVRNIKQLIDLLGQVGDVAVDAMTARAARRGADRLFRGVVAASSVVSLGDDDVVESAGGSAGPGGDSTETAR